jgi:hypothetical protein
MRKNAASVYLPVLLVRDSAFSLEIGKTLVEIVGRTLEISQSESARLE